MSSFHQSYGFNLEETVTDLGNYKVHLWQLPEALAFLKTRCTVFCGRLSQSSSISFLWCLEIRGNSEWCSCFLFLFFNLLLVLPISFKPEAKSWQPVGQFSLWMCFVWLAGCFFKFSISCQHLKKKIKRFHQKKKSGFPAFLEKIRRPEDIGAACHVAVVHRSWAGRGPLGRGMSPCLGPTPTWPATFLYFTYQPHPKTSQRMRLPKYLGH